MKNLSENCGRTFGFNALERELAGTRKLVKPTEGALQKTSDLDRSAVTRSTRETLVACAFGFAHLVHPRPAVEPIATKDETSFPVDLDVDVLSMLGTGGA